MNRSVLWLFLVIAPLVSAGSLGSFQGTCSSDPSGGSGNCSGMWDSSFSFDGPFFPGFPGPNQFGSGAAPLVIDFEVGTSGGNFSYEGATCNYGMVIGGSSCYGRILLESYTFGPPADTGLSAGDVVSVVAQPGRKVSFALRVVDLPVLRYST